MGLINLERGFNFAVGTIKTIVTTHYRLLYKILYPFKNMLNEALQHPCAKYLLASMQFSDNAIRLWKGEMKSHLRDKPKDTLYHKYLAWKRAENEIAIFTLYAYADLSIPKQFDCIFENDNPEIYFKTPFTLSQSIYEGLYPIDCIEHGHKHLCIFTFDNKIPDIFNQLYYLDEKYPKDVFGYPKLGLCKYQDLEAIKERKNYMAELEKIHGKNWHEFDDPERYRVV
jgi:hypothetical protein